MGCDAKTLPTCLAFQYFNPRTHRGVRHLSIWKCSCDNELFQSTHPSWGATKQMCHKYILHMQFQSTHPSWGATDVFILFILGHVISIHAPIVGCDLFFKVIFTPKHRFQSTHPSWGATSSKYHSGDILKDFNPRTHRGVRLPWTKNQGGKERFQSTHPSWGATAKIAKFLLEFHYF